MDNVIFVISPAPQIQKEYRPQKNEENEKKEGGKKKQEEREEYEVLPDLFSLRLLCGGKGVLSVTGKEIGIMLPPELIRN